MSFLSGSGGQSVPRPLFARGPASWERWELRAVIAGPDRSEVSSDWLLFAHSLGALFLQVSKRDRKWVANEQWCPRLKGTAFKFHYSAAFSESEDPLTRIPFFSPRHKAHFFFFFFLLNHKSGLKRTCLYLSGIEFQICIYVQETVETVFTQHTAFTHITIKSDVQATGNSINLHFWLTGTLRGHNSVLNLALFYAH